MDTVVLIRRDHYCDGPSVTAAQICTREEAEKFIRNFEGVTSNASFEIYESTDIINSIQIQEYVHGFFNFVSRNVSTNVVRTVGEPKFGFVPNECLKKLTEEGYCKDKFVYYNSRSSTQVFNSLNEYKNNLPNYTVKNDLIINLDFSTDNKVLFYKNGRHYEYRKETSELYAWREMWLDIDTMEPTSEMIPSGLSEEYLREMGVVYKKELVKVGEHEYV